MFNFKVFLKGAAMGCADLIPGVSGGTIALITGIYEQLIQSIRSMDAQALRYLIGFQFQALWQHINGSFLLPLLSGIFLSIFSLSRVITYLLEHHPIPLWSFFFGLIFISVFFVAPKVIKISTIISFIFGAIVAYFITSLTPQTTTNELWFVFLSGAIAICAMILPGISGSFILILLAKYEFILGAVKSLDVKVIAVFGMGCIVGLLSFSKLIHWMLSHYRSITMAALAGFMLGSLNKIWPWKQVSEVSFTNFSPFQYTKVTGEPNNLWIAIVFCVVGGVIVMVLERLGRR